MRSGEFPSSKNSFSDIDETYIGSHERIGEQFIIKWEEALQTMSMEQFLKHDRQFDEDQTFQINLGRGSVVEPTDRQLRNNEKTAVTIYRQQCEERATDILNECGMVN